MTLYETRGLREAWAESLKKVRAHGGEVTHFMNLLSDAGKEKLLTVKEHTRSMPPDVMIKYGFDGENKAESTGFNVNYGFEFINPARDYDFDKIVASMEEDVLESITMHCLYEQKILTSTNIMHQWSSEAVDWASRESAWYYNILVGSYVFDEVDESKKLPKYFFKNTSTAPRTFADAFPNINIYNAKKMEENKKAMKASEKKMENDIDCFTPHTPEAQPEEFVLSKHLSVFDLGVVVSCLGASAVKQYKQQEKKRARRLALFHSKKLQRFTDHDIEKVIHQQRRRQIKGLLA